jgi:hypothetical protein
MGDCEIVGIKVEGKRELIHRKSQTVLTGTKLETWRHSLTYVSTRQRERHQALEIWDHAFQSRLVELVWCYHLKVLQHLLIKTGKDFVTEEMVGQNCFWAKEETQTSLSLEYINKVPF